MRSYIRVVSTFAMLAALASAQLTGCSNVEAGGSSETESTGSIRLALSAAAQNGVTFRLRAATFLITDLRTNEVVQTLFSEDSPAGASEVSAELTQGSYTVTLLDGWFLERLGGSSAPSGGSSGTVGSAGSGTAGRPFGGDVGEGGAMAGGGGPIDPAAFAGEGGQGGSAGDGGPPARGGSFGTGGVAGSGTGAPPPSGEVVDAVLLSDEVQPFFISGGDDIFLSYFFQVGGDVIDFNRGRVHIGIGVFDASPCVPPEGSLQASRVLVEHSLPALEGVSLRSAFGALAASEDFETDPVLLYQQVIDSYASAPNGRLPDAVHCGDEITDGVPTLNGYPITCDRQERFQIDNIDRWFVTAFVNRVDLAPQNGAHCGQQRVIFSTNAQNRMFIIFEAQLPNPRPELGIRGCAPIAQFWLDANEIDDPLVRGARLRQAFFEREPTLEEAGVGAFLSARNLTVGTGQLRTNQFDQDPWTLREFKLAIDEGALTVLPFPVGESPAGALWDESIPLPQGPACRANFIEAAQGLLTDEPEEMSFVVDHACKDAESRNDGSESYPELMSPGLRASLTAAFEGSGLTADELATRAQFAGSCTGCHTEAVGRDLGNNVTAPFSLGFTHVDEFAVSCADGPCFALSDAMESVFLPRRMRVMSALLEIDPPVDTCSSGGQPGSGGRPGSGGGPSVGGASNEGGDGSLPPGVAGSSGSGNEPLEPGPAPEVEITLPPASTPIDELQEADSQIREAYGDKTLGGRDARVTH